MTTEMERRNSQGFYVPAYDGLRFFLLLGVLEFHYWYGRVPIARIWFLTYALPCFFALSGFLITHLLVRGQDAPGMPSYRRILINFWLRRALRVFPAYFFVLLLASITLGVPYPEWQITYLFNIKLFCLSATAHSPEFVRYMAGWQTHGIHLWSMSVEEQFYLLYPPLLLMTAPRWRTAMLALGIVACIGTRLCLGALLPNSYYGALLPVAGEYVLWGCLVAWLDLQGSTLWLRSGRVLWASLGGLLAMFCLDHDLNRYLAGQWQPPAQQTLYAILLSLFVVALKHQPDSWVSRGLSWKPFTRLGKISYGAYLVHLFLNPLVDRMLAWCPGLAFLPQAPQAILGPLVALSAAGLMWVSFEERANRIKDRSAP